MRLRAKLELPVLIALSGPDGSGKSSLARSLLECRGPEAANVYLYGCFACRRWTGQPLSSKPHAETSRSRPLTAVGSAHALLDAFEMSLRLAVALLRALLSRRGLVITDRGPLDALAKHDPAERSLTGRWYMWLARRYQVNFLLDADAATLARRDGEHSELELERARGTFDRWATMLPNCVRIRTDAHLTAARP